ncbi:hypothetical protein L1A97_04530 [Listeria monocytogenes]|uniref:hypothetical protein n=1 Tax=Listeria monocytogenes TaxID=1639 RepID=UPI002079C2E9|nr:hypothetical protein [Listeria monocytogenes]MCM8889321.1 hypothetical protein [Listeria monocytogenes]
MPKQDIILNEANRILHRKGNELSKNAATNSKDLRRFAMGLEKLAEKTWNYVHEYEEAEFNEKLKGRS